MFKKLFGLEPKLTQDGAYSPSFLALKLATKQKTDYDNSKYTNKHKKKLFNL